MKKPVLATMGVVGACAACCAIPLALPLLSGLSVASLASINWDGLNIGRELAVAGAALVAAGLVWGGLWWSRKRKAAACAATVATPGASGAPAAGSACGCSSTTSPKERT